jgi:hypothetical protein
LGIDDSRVDRIHLTCVHLYHSQLLDLNSQ